MFNGIVECTGVVDQIESTPDCLKMAIKPHCIFEDLSVGASVAVNGVCLTITQLFHNTFDTTIVPETIRLTNLGDLCVGNEVNLERSLKANGRISGHYVQGHIDGVGKILELKPDGKEAMLAKISLPQKLAKYVVNKGYIALDGMSITTIESSADWFMVTFIPHTKQATIVKHYHKDRKVNIEVDILSKFVEKVLRTGK